MKATTWILAGSLMLAMGIGEAAVAAEQRATRRQASKPPQADGTDQGERVSRRTEVFPSEPGLPPSVVVRQDVVYGSPDGHDLHLDVVMRRQLPDALGPWEVRPYVVSVIQHEYGLPFHP